MLRNGNCCYGCHETWANYEGYNPRCYGWYVSHLHCKNVNISNNQFKSHIGIIAIYGLVVSVLIAGSLDKPPVYTLYKGFLHLGAGLAVGFSGLAAGFAIGTVGESGVRGTAQQPRLFVGMILILIFAEVLGLYGLIVAIYLFTKWN